MAKKAITEEGMGVIITRGGWNNHYNERVKKRDNVSMQDNDERMQDKDRDRE